MANSGKRDNPEKTDLAPVTASKNKDDTSESESLRARAHDAGVQAVAQALAQAA